MSRGREGGSSGNEAWLDVVAGRGEGEGCGAGRAGEAIEVALTEAVGLVLAEPAIGDVDLPPFYCAACDGYALRAGDATAGRPAPGRRAAPGPGGRRGRPGRGGASRRGSPCRSPPTRSSGPRAPAPSPAPGPPAGRGPPRGREGPERGPSRRPHPLLPDPAAAVGHPAAAVDGRPAGRGQGCVHPVCHRRVRVAVVAVGDHLVGPGEAPVLDRERNAAGLTVVAPCFRRAATPAV